MRFTRWTGYVGAVACLVAILAQNANAAPALDLESAGDDSLSFSLKHVDLLMGGGIGAIGLQSQDSTEISTYDSGGGWGIDGPVFLRSADPVPPGELELKFVGRFGQPSDDTDNQDYQFDFVAEWGFAENWEFIFEMPVELGDGRVEGNGDIAEFGFHTKLWDEADWYPAFAVRNLISIPTGYHSSGVDYLLRGLFTGTCIPDQLRWHLNPWAKAVNGDNDDDARNFLWGVALGFDYRLTDDVNFIADYQYNRGDDEGDDDDQQVEAGVDWSIADDQMIGLAATFGVDGDDSGTDYGLAISYIISLDAPRMDR